MKLARSYQPELYEASIYALWEKLEAFKPAQKGQGYSLVVPPPNANGNLHMGHALSFAIQDIAARYHRSLGERVLFVPGADHAGFETQVVYERQLEKEGKSRFDYSREELYKNIFDFVAANRTNFESQIRRLGASVDWSHYTFTLDPAVVKQTYSTFKAMWDDGLIYRGERLVNFCSFHGTAFADIEVSYQDEATFLWQIRYPLVDGSGEIVVATTRPETMLGDTAVAVNPSDQRYQNLIGKTIRLPLTKREIPIIADSYVQPEFGTGAVKITPAHDPNDFDMAKRHDLPFITVIDFSGHLAHDTPEPFRGLSVLEGREAVIAELRKQGLLVDAIEYTHSVGHCYKCNTIIEPLLKEQWFIDIKPLASKAAKELRDGSIDFLPTAKGTQLINYLDTIRDWNISRQIAWGIPIPAFQNEEDPSDWIYHESVDKEIISVNNKTYRRDPDVFDTWFSSSSWPYSTLGYPDSKDFQDFYPLSLMETGFDILMPWVSRMIMLGLYVTNKVPFKTVYLHGLIMDPSGQKMSKSKGNVVDPIKTIEEFGSDALRIGVLMGQTPGNNQPFVQDRVVSGRNFCNKLWNIARFIESQVEDFKVAREANPSSPADYWILSRYNLTIKKASALMNDYRFSEAYELIYHFIWDDVADWYIEISKESPNKSVLAQLLEAILVLVHPFMPFVSEAIWQDLAFSSSSLLSNKQLVDLPSNNKDKARDFETIKNLIISIRATLKAINAKDVTLYYQEEPLIDEFASTIKQLAKLKNLEAVDQERGLAVVDTKLNCWLDISQDQIDDYIKSLAIKIENGQKNIDRLKTRLSNSDYVAQAPKELVDQTKDQLLEAEKNIESWLLEKLRFRSD